MSTTCPGFSPIECYNDVSNVGPWSDIYMIGATFRTFIERESVQSAEGRATEDTVPLVSKRYKKKYPDGFLNMIDQSMMLNPKERPQQISDLVSILNS